MMQNMCLKYAYGRFFLIFSNGKYSHLILNKSHFWLILIVPYRVSYVYVFLTLPPLKKIPAIINFPDRFF